jgi:hypothetical protein
MKALKIVIQSLVVFSLITTFQIAATSLEIPTKTKKTRTSQKAKLPHKKHSAHAKVLKKATHLDTTVGNAIEEVKNYLHHLDTKYHLQLSSDEKNNLVTTTKHMIYLKAGNEAPSTHLKVSDLYKIKKSLKGHLRMFHPEKFMSPKPKTSKAFALHELPRKLAKRTIRETTKDYLINTCRITDPQEVYVAWKSIKPLVDKKLDTASYRSDYDELLVPRETIGKILQVVYQELTLRGIRPQKAQVKKTPVFAKKQVRTTQTTKKKISRSRSKRARSRQPSRRPYHSRKEIERRIPLAQAQHMITQRLEQEKLNSKDQAFLRAKIMKRITQSSTSKGYIYPRVVQQIIESEIAQFVKLKKVITPKKRAKKRSVRHRHYVQADLDELE